MITISEKLSILDERIKSVEFHLECLEHAKNNNPRLEDFYSINNSIRKLYNKRDALNLYKIKLAISN